ncbi:hypothetical protein CA13_30630 [Planctomycetes bacterium CA13]|uniref:Uncharacterized protein n=1 Tax=Novipirellula herctigrandis TaxID=2527986 RepID=A0A5C5Z364_9BACT|nr:hypothetical protein CA13_30630 [Planctomycetes bacterium CA13]
MKLINPGYVGLFSAVVCVTALAAQVDDIDLHTDQSSLQLGVLVGACPEQDVCVLDTKDEMCRQMRLLPKEMGQWKRSTLPAKNGDDTVSNATMLNKSAATNDDISQLEPSQANPLGSVILVQYDSSRGFPPNISNDWTGSRYRNQNNETRQYRYRLPYRRVYRYPYYRYQYQYYPHWYYYYRGTPYYYGGVYW